MPGVVCKSIQLPSLGPGLLDYSAKGVCSSRARNSASFFPSQNCQETHQLCPIKPQHMKSKFDRLFSNLGKVQGDILITSKKRIYINVVTQSLTATVSAATESKAARSIIKLPKDEMEPIVITSTSSWALLTYLHFQVLLPYLQVSYCGSDKVGLNTLGGELGSSWQGCPDPRLKLKTGAGPHDGGSELLNIQWGNNKISGITEA